MLLDGHTASSVAKRLGLSGTNMLYRWKGEQLAQSGPVASVLEVRARELEIEHRPNGDRRVKRPPGCGARRFQ